MRWIKCGRIFEPQPEHHFIRSHVQMPAVLPCGDRLRIYFSTRPEPGLSLGAFIDVAIDDPLRVLFVNDAPLLALGAPGSFDEHGIMPTMALERDDAVLLYYTGWSRLNSAAPYNNSSGLAISRDGGTTFERAVPGPVLGRTAYEPYSATLSWVEIDGVGGWHCWYSSTSGWIKDAERLETVYLICTAHSADGVGWKRDGRPVIPTVIPHEAQSRPTLLYRHGRWHMWFSYRGSHDFRGGTETYRMGYAWSKDRVAWHRDDSLAGIDVSPTGWDSQMVAYPYVVETPSGPLMFYNGNGFGQSGLGYARLED